jgi:hypothetical protein
LGGSDLSHYCERSRCVNTADAVDCVSWYHLLPVAQTLMCFLALGTRQHRYRSWFRHFIQDNLKFREIQ